MNNAYPPFERNGDIVTFSGDYTALKREIAPGAQFRVNADTEAIFNEQVNNVVYNPATPLTSLDTANLQFGSYYIDTAVATAAADSAATVGQVYTQAENTIISSVSVPVANSYNASILMSVTGITYDTDGKITSVTATFSSHQYDSATGNYTQATNTITFNDTNSDGDPESPGPFVIGNINLDIDLTNAVMKGDQAVINVNAAVPAAPPPNYKQITVRNENGDNLQWFFNTGVLDNKNSTLNFYSVDTDNGENYNGSISFKAGTIDNLNDAVSFTFGNMFDMLVYLRKKLEASNFEEASNMLKYIDQKSEMILQARSEFGARVNHFEAVRDQYGDQETVLSDVLQNLEDSDIAKININYEEALAAYESVLSSGSKIMKTSLLDYLS
ncbi:MAG: flagellar hook-associated protein FlgL [Pelotomaculum sp. PtaB.Bin104]|nr:MAG: flagellar hook-associated protein FlgL [Pelotomaculum sp. PtaB.Bin104]